MLSGALIQLIKEFDIEKLDGVIWEREEKGFALKSVIQFQGSLLVERGITARCALVIHQDIEKMPSLKEEGGKFSIEYRDYVKTSWANIYIIPGSIVADKLEHRRFIIQIINKALRTDVAHNVFLDTAAMARDHRDQWVRSFSDRKGRVDSGTLFGDGVEQDSVFGPELMRSRSRSVGWYTSFFGSLDKVRVSPRGSVTLWANPPIELFLRFIRYEILPYVIALP